MWQLASEATKASSGSTAAASDQGAGTTDGAGEAATTAPPSNDHWCARLYAPCKNRSEGRCQRMVAVCWWAMRAPGGMLGRQRLAQPPAAIVVAADPGYPCAGAAMPIRASMPLTSGHPRAARFNAEAQGR